MKSIEDLSLLSYKELRLLAAENQIPGNMKKGAFVKIIDAAKKGNKLEVTRLLSVMKRNKKKKLECSKVAQTKRKMPSRMCKNNCKKLAEPNYSSSRDEMYKFESHFVKIEKDDVDTNQYQNFSCNLSSVVNQLMHDPLDCSGKFNSANNAVFDETTNFHAGFAVSDPNQSFVETSLCENEVSDKKKSFLLQKMLQAPFGTNLGEIETREQFLDNSETMTANSDVNEIDEILQNILPESMYHDFENGKTNGAYNNFSNNNGFPLDENENFSSLELYQQYDQRQLPYNLNTMSQLNAQENCRNWIVSNNQYTYDSAENPAMQESSRANETENPSFNDSLNTINTIENIPSVATDNGYSIKSEDCHLDNKNGSSHYYTPTSPCFQFWCQGQQPELEWQNSNNLHSNTTACFNINSYSPELRPQNFISSCTMFNNEQTNTALEINYSNEIVAENILGF